MREIIAKLPPETYPILADYFGRIAADLERMTNQRSMAEAYLDKCTERANRLKEAAARAAHLPQDESIRQMQREGHGGELGLFYLGRAQVAYARAQREDRDRKISMMLKDGVSKAEIARRLKLHVQTVYRVTAKQGEKP